MLPFGDKGFRAARPYQFVEKIVEKQKINRFRHATQHACGVQTPAAGLRIKIMQKMELTQLMFLSKKWIETNHSIGLVSNPGRVTQDRHFCNILHSYRKRVFKY